MWLTLLVFLCNLNLQAAETPHPAAPPVPKPPARVVISSAQGAVDNFDPQPAVVRQLVQKGIISLTGKKTERDAWRSLVSTQDVVGLKVFSNPGRYSGTRKEVVEAVIIGLRDAGISPSNIIVWDRHMVDLQLSGFVDMASRYGVRVEASTSAGWDEKVFYENSILGKPVWGDFEFEKKGDDIGRKSYMSKLVSQRITKIISIAPMLNHNHVGTAGHLYSLSMGSMDNTIRFEGDSARLAVAVPEVFALNQLADHFVLGITDALICQYQGEQRTLLHYSAILNELRFSRDPVALDVLSVKELDRQRKAAGYSKEPTSLEVYQNAQLLELGVADTERIKVERAD